MNTLILYGTKYGCTEKCARLLAQKLVGKVDLLNAKDSSSIDFSAYDSIVIGGSIYIGKIQKEVSEFCTNHMEILKKKRLGFFICGMQNEALQSELDAAFPKELRDIALAKECFGGEFVIKKVNFMEKMIIKMVAKTDKDILNVSEAAIESFAKKMSAAA